MVRRDEKLKQAIMDCQSAFGTAEGKRFLSYLMSKTTIARPSAAAYAEGLRIDTSRLLFDEGQRCMMLHIIKLINADPNKPLPEDVISERS